MKRYSPGFTLIELMTTIAIAGILAAIAVPSLQQIVINRSADRLAQELQIDLMYARSQAITLRKEVKIRPLASDQWHQGWQLIQKDESNNDIVIRQKGSANTHLAKNGEIASSPEFKDGFSFDGQGRLITATPGQATAGTFTISVPKCKGNRLREIKILYLGQITTEAKPCP